MGYWTPQVARFQAVALQPETAGNPAKSRVVGTKLGTVAACVKFESEGRAFLDQLTIDGARMAEIVEVNPSPQLRASGAG
jgi:hypothetical protein